MSCSGQISFSSTTSATTSTEVASDSKTCGAKKRFFPLYPISISASVSLIVFVWEAQVEYTATQVSGTLAAFNVQML